MKKIFILTSILFAMISCNEQPDTNVYHKVEKTNDVYKVKADIINLSEEYGDLCLRTVVIDSCEYLIGSGHDVSKGFGYLSHKGNCKYCTERRKQELKNQNNYENKDYSVQQRTR